jgi:hypothetical protein
MALAANNTTKHSQSTNCNMSSNTYTASQNASSSSNASLNLLIAFVTIPKLTQAEKDLLDIHQRCSMLPVLDVLCWSLLLHLHH